MDIRNKDQSLAKMLCVLAVNKAAEAKASQIPLSDSAMVAATDAVDLYISISVGGKPYKYIEKVIERACDSLEYSLGRDNSIQAISDLVMEVRKERFKTVN